MDTNERIAEWTSIDPFTSLPNASVQIDLLSPCPVSVGDGLSNWRIESQSHLVRSLLHTLSKPILGCFHDHLFWKRGSLERAWDQCLEGSLLADYCYKHRWILRSLSDCFVAGISPSPQAITYKHFQPVAVVPKLIESPAKTDAAFLIHRLLLIAKIVTNRIGFVPNVVVVLTVYEL